MATAKRNLEALKRRQEYLRRVAQNDSQRQELSALNWAVEQLTVVIASAEKKRNEEK